MTGGATAGSGRTFRLDPEVLPARGFLEAGGGTFFLDRDRAVVRPAREGHGAILIIGIGDFSGVAVRIARASDPVSLSLELTHPDPHLSLPLATSDQHEDLANDWEAWSRTLDLPLLVAFPDGSVERHDANERTAAFAPPKPRRRHAYLAGRRPRFLKRRKTGLEMTIVRITEREIIARH
ncbi:MAG: DUF6101 family protein [Alphaproteobacteria bacterium]